jgi:hypothetical protein
LHLLADILRRKSEEKCNRKEKLKATRIYNVIGHTFAVCLYVLRFSFDRREDKDKERVLAEETFLVFSLSLLSAIHTHAVMLYPIQRSVTSTSTSVSEGWHVQAAAVLY